MWAPYDPISYLAHVSFGFLAVAGAITALSVRKGSPLHKKAGWTFVIPMVVAATTALIFEAEIDEARPLVIVMSVATFYLLATSVLAIRREWRYAPVLEKVSVVIPSLLFVFSTLAIIRSALSGALLQIPGPSLYAGVFLLLVVGDVRLIRVRPQDRLYWTKRHLFRMLLAFAFAIRALFAIGIETGLPFGVVVTTPLILALGTTWYFFQKLERSG